MSSFSKFTFLSCNGKTNINVHRFDPDGEPRAIVQLAHGVADHISRYDDFAAYLADNGFIVVGNDHLGHGESINDESELGFFGENSGWELAVGDMRRLYEMTSQEYPKLPYFMFGHSMGSFLVRTYIIRYRAGLSGAVICGTGQQPAPLVEAGILMGKAEIKKNGAMYKSEKLNTMAFGQYNAAFAPSRTLSDWVSRDEAMVDKYVEDPLCGYIPSAGLFVDMLTGIKYISKARNLERMKDDLPVLFISGDKDPVGENGKGVIRAYESFLEANMSDVTLKLYHNCRHELLNELNRKDIYRDVLQWLNNKM